MIDIDPTRPAELVASIHSPWRATVGECLRRWTSLDESARVQSFLVVRGDEPDARYTLNSNRIAELATRLRPAPSLAG